MDGNGDLGITGGGSTGIPEIVVSGVQPGISGRFGPGGMSILTGPFTGGIGAYASPFGMGDFTPSIPTPVMPQSKPEKTFGEKAKESILGFLKRLARVHPATRNAAFALDFVKGLQDAKMYKVASLPLIVVQQLAKKGIMTMSGQLQDRERFFKWLNDPDNEKFKIYPKKV